jgi:hypothetical protein
MDEQAQSLTARVEALEDALVLLVGALMRVGVPVREEFIAALQAAIAAARQTNQRSEKIAVLRLFADMAEAARGLEPDGR